MKIPKDYLLDKYFPTLPQDEKELWYKCCDWAPVVVHIMSEYGVDCAHEIWDNKSIIAKSNIDWDEVYRRYKEWYMTEPRSWQEAINVFKWMKKTIINIEKEEQDGK